VIQSCYGLLASVSFGKIFPDFCEAAITSTRMFKLVRKLINAAHFCNKGSLVFGRTSTCNPYSNWSSIDALL
jgi:hypothetical protein